MKKYVIVDLEMCNVPKRKRKESGFFRSNELIEIGAVLLNEEYEITDRFKTFVHPQYGEIDAFIQKLTGISKKDTENAPTAEEALELFAKWLPDDVILVSWSESDMHQIQKEMEFKHISNKKMERLLETWEDCQKTFSEKMNSDKVYNLKEALIIADIDFDENIHDGLIDAENTAMLFAKMKKETKLKLISCYMTEDEDDGLFTPIAGLLKNFTYAV